MAKPRKSSSRERIFQIIAMAAIPLIIISAIVLVVSLRSPGSPDPYAGRPIYVNPESSASLFAAEQKKALVPDSADTATFVELAEQPTATWLTPERYPIGEVGTTVSRITADAERNGALPLFVIYGIPNRDCKDLKSAGGLPADQYATWVDEIGAALTDTPSLVIIEPDALALAVECNNVDERVSEVAQVVDVMAEAQVTAYIDAGHSNWRSPEDMAGLLNRAGIEKVRGFATNVSNFNTTPDERAYADQVSGLTNNKNFVIDTSRNGDGSNGEWCNPSGRALGERPAAASDDSALDATLWIKPPGESDGTCNGGPAAGTWWPEYALGLASRAGW